jgi:antitoxin (DNA-binding transcriptional repressor) of toxin-antitoxin stability system
VGVSDPTRVVNVQEAKTHLSRLLREVEAGEDIAIARGGRVIARLVRAEADVPRAWGCFVGQVHWDEDAFEPLAADEQARWDRGGVDP